MLAPALDHPDPVLLFEHGALYNTTGPAQPEPGAPTDIATAAIRRPGEHLTLVTYGGSLPKAMRAAEQLAGEGASAEVVDLRVLRPLDRATILDSVTRTHRLVVIDEGWRTGSLSAEIAAIAAEHAFYELDAPIERVCTAEVPLPYARHLEEAALPSVERIVDASRRALGRGPGHG
jgi:pyruvate dehydrogenase E1 component beta subunit